MDERLAAADAALKAGRGAEAIEPLIALLSEAPAQSLQLYRVLLLQLFHAGRTADGEAWSAKALARFPRDFDILNLRGVFLRRLKRYPEAIRSLEQAARISPANTSGQTNLGNVYMDSGDFARAEAVFAKLARKAPRNAEFQRQTGRALRAQGRADQALVRLRQSVALRKDSADSWLEIIGTLVDQQRHAEAEEAADRALDAMPDAPRLLEAKVMAIRASGQLRRAQAFLEAIAPAHPDAAWLEYHLAMSINDYDRDVGNRHMRRAIELDPANVEYRMMLVESLERTRTGDEGANIEAAYQLLLETLALTDDKLKSSHLKIAYEVFVRVCDFDAWVKTGRHTALVKLLSRVATHEDRLELIQQHLAWGRAVQAIAAKAPLHRPPPRAPGGPIRLGLLSSDLRRHPVGYFALPLFEHLDRDRFELYAYSFFQGVKADPTQQLMTERATAFRWTPDIGIAQAAQMIADDQLDMLIDLGGSTHMNKLEVMAYRPAPLQASWLGYPHSAGLTTIDYLVVDPFIAPTLPDLLIEQPLPLSHCWYPMSQAAFHDLPAAEPEPPMARNGFVTFGTANNPQKYNREVIAAWARVMRQCPGSRFLFIRPEGSCETFRRNLVGEFARGGITGDRLIFEAVRGSHLPHYNRLDISLDAFPQTGGTTTCESLWMGAPCVTLVGEGPYERLSYSVLMNLGLDDLCALTPDAYVEAAVGLAHNGPRVAALRAGMRDRVKASPLGQSEAWARDFYSVIGEVVARGRP